MPNAVAFAHFDVIHLLGEECVEAVVPDSVVDGFYPGVPDDRWAFTAHTTPLNYDATSAPAVAIWRSKKPKPPSN